MHVIERVKDFLGIEGLRLTLRVHGEPELVDGVLAGEIALDSLREQRVERLSLLLTERYSRGRGESRLIDTYELGGLVREVDIAVGAGEQVVVPFDLHFAPRPSPAERFLAAKPLAGALTRLARLTVGAASEYELRASAQVRGISLTPTASLPLAF